MNKIFHNVIGARKNIISFYNMFAGRLLSNESHPRPFFLSHMLTNKCNCTCGFCYWKYPVSDELSTDEVVDLYKQASKIGFAHLSIWGGEPLLRKDVIEVAKQAQKTGLLVTLVTNGYYLPEKIEIANHIDTIALSIDAPDGKLHDEIRGRKGCFERAIDGMEKIKKDYPWVRRRLNCVVHNCNADMLEDMCRIASKIKALIYFCPIGKIESISGWQGEQQVNALNLDKKRLAEIYSLLLGLKKAGYPVANSEYMLKHFIKNQPEFKCFLPRSHLYVYSNGDVESCFKGKFASIKKQSLKEILKSKLFKEIIEMGDSCTLSCSCSEAIEGSGIWQWKYGSLKEWLWG